MNDPVLTVQQMQAAEQRLMDGGIDVHQLMQRAGRGAAEWVRRVAAGRSVTVLCGPGNNGGDGYVIAETLRARGLPVRLVAPIKPKTEAALRARKGFAGDVVTSAEGISGGVFVDCLFGSGLARGLSDALSQMVHDLAARHQYSIAVDLPSGVESDTGAMLSDVPPFDLTVCLGAWKQAHFLMPAMAQMGALKLVDIRIEEVTGAAQRIACPRLVAPAMDAHKYRRGLLAIVGGSMPGAAMLSARAAMQAGAGYVKLLSDHAQAVTPADLVLDGRALSDAISDERINACLIGPGLGRDGRALERLGAALQRDTAIVLDADALMLLTPDMLAGRSHSLIVTPHEGELAALEKAFGTSGSDKPSRAAELAKAMHAVVVAKGPDTLVAAPDRRLALAGRTSSWLSTAGTGDVLAGIIASRLATGAEPYTAACEGVWLHAEAARLAGAAFTATKLADQVGHAYAACL